MKSDFIFTRSRLGLDVKVWLVMLSVVVLCLGLLSYRVISNNRNKPCVTTEAIINGLKHRPERIYNINELLLFKASTSPHNDIVWDFGDNTPRKEGFTASHVFKKPGIFAVTILVNGKCDDVARVTVIKPIDVVRDSVGNITDYIVGPEQGRVLESVTFTTPLKANTYEWTIENRDDIKVRTDKEATYSFKNSDVYTVILTLDGNPAKKYRKSFVIMEVPGASNANDEVIKPKKLIKDEYPVIVPEEKPEVVAPPPVVTPPVTGKTEPEPEAKKFRKINDDLLKMMLEELIKGNKSPADFNAYLCNGEGTQVIENDKVSTFAALCANIKGKKVELKSVKQGRLNDCINSLTVTYKKKGKVLGIF